MVHILDEMKTGRVPGPSDAANLELGNEAMFELCQSSKWTGNAS